MELTECICAEIEDMRQKKRLRFQAASAQTDKVISDLTSRRSTLFEALENELQAQELPRIGTQELQAKQPRKTESADFLNGRQDCKKQMPAEYEDLSDTEADNGKEARDDMQATAVSEASGPAENEDAEQTRIERLRKDAADTDTQLHHERSHLQALRSALAVSLARLDALEEDLCKLSSTWEREEKLRLSIEDRPEKSLLKRKRSPESSSESSATSSSKRVLRKAAETLMVLGIGAGIAVVKQAYS